MTIKNMQWNTALSLAAKTGFVENVQMIPEKGVYPNTISYKETYSSAMQEAAKQRCKDIFDVLKNDGNVNIKDKYVTPLGVMAECGHCDVLEHLNHNDRGRKYLIAATSQTLIQESGPSTVHSADSQNQCLELVIENGLDVNTLLSEHITSNTYDDRRGTALCCAVSNNEILHTKILLKAGANPIKDPLNYVIIAVRADCHGIVKLLLSYGADVNLILLLNDSHFPSAFGIL
ncbi:LOW QUALITY PROTEIN: ankyrin repeat and SOCS box protein 15 [Ammospiza maritima maritima]